MLWPAILALALEKDWVSSQDSWTWVAPAGEQLVFLANSQGQLFKCSLSDHQARLFSDSVVPWGISPSPDGSKLALISRGRVQVFDTSGHLVFRSKRFYRPGFPVWVSSSRIAYTGDGQLFFMDKAYPGFENVVSISYSPNKGLFAYCDITGRALWVFDPRTQTRRPVFSDSLGLFAPVWSGDGSQIALDRLGPGFWLLNTDNWSATLVDSGQAAAWWGKSLVYQITHDDGRRITSSKLMIRDSTGQTRVLFSDGVPVSPRVNGNRVFFLDQGKAGYITLQEQ